MCNNRKHVDPRRKTTDHTKLSRGHGKFFGIFEVGISLLGISDDGTGTRGI
jgi:hypothetical protein